MIRLAFVLAFVCPLAIVADTVILRDGRTIEGTYLGGDARTIRVAVADKVESFDIGQVSQVRFGADAPKPAAAPKRAERMPILRPDPAPVAAAAPAHTPAMKAELPAGASLVIRMIDDVDSQRDSVGQTFRASLDEPVMQGEQVLIPRGADVTVKLVDDKQSGKLTGRTELTLDLVSVVVNGKTVDVLTHEVTQASESRTTQTAQRTGGAAALGAVIGAIAGGGRGAAIGAVTGAAAGGAVQVLTKGQRVRIPSETRLQFTLQQPLAL